MAATTMVKEYDDRKAFDKAAQKLARDGWLVVSVTERTQRSGCMRILMLGGIGALVFKPKPTLVVTYSRPPAVP